MSDSGDKRYFPTTRKKFASCKQCDNKFQQKRDNQFFCSDLCRTRFHNKETKAKAEAFNLLFKEIRNAK